MKLTSLQFILVVATLCLVAGGSYKLGQNSVSPRVIVREVPAPMPQLTGWTTVTKEEVVHTQTYKERKNEAYLRAELDSLVRPEKLKLTPCSAK